MSNNSNSSILKNKRYLSNREFICESCDQVIDRDLNAAINIRDFGLNKIGEAIPESTPMDKGALAVSNNSETTLDEVGISECTYLYT